MADASPTLPQPEGGESQAAEQLLPLVYEELRKLAARRLSQEQPGQTLQATALVHEAYLRLAAGQPDRTWDSRGHFFAAAAEAMRRILIDVARRKGSQKGGGSRLRVDLTESALSQVPELDELLMLNEALSALELDDPSVGQLAKLRLFAGLSVDESAEMLGVSRRTAFRQWAYARAFLQLMLQEHDSTA